MRVVPLKNLFGTAGEFDSKDEEVSLQIQYTGSLDPGEEGLAFEVPPDTSRPILFQLEE